MMPIRYALLTEPYKHDSYGYVYPYDKGICPIMNNRICICPVCHLARTRKAPSDDDEDEYRDEEVPVVEEKPKKKKVSFFRRFFLCFGRS